MFSYKKIFQTGGPPFPPDTFRKLFVTFRQKGQKIHFGVLRNHWIPHSIFRKIILKKNVSLGASL